MTREHYGASARVGFEVPDRAMLGREFKEIAIQNIS